MKKILAAVLGLGAVLVLLFFILFVKFTTPRDVSRMDVDTLLAEYLSSPVPDGIIGASSSGVITFTSTEVVLEFSVRDVLVFDKIIRDGGFLPLDGPQLAEARDLFRKRLPQADGIYGKFKKGSVEFIYLAIDKRKRRGSIYYGGG